MVEPKKCRKCGGTDFNPSGGCRPCRAQYQRDRNAGKLVKEKQCVSCGRVRAVPSEIRIDARFCKECKADGTRNSFAGKEGYAKFKDVWYAHRMTPEVRERENAALRARPFDHPTKVASRERSKAVLQTPEGRERNRLNAEKQRQRPERKAYFRDYATKRERMKAEAARITEGNPVHKAAVLEWYRQAQLQGLTVDHIVPLTHPKVCGLHVPWNMQLLTDTENKRKNNKLPPEDQQIGR